MGEGLAKNSMCAWAHGHACHSHRPQLRFRIVGTFQIGIGAIANVKTCEYFKVAAASWQRSHTSTHWHQCEAQRYCLARALPLHREEIGYKADDWQTTNQPWWHRLYHSQCTHVVVSITLLIVAGFGIYNIMSMTMLQRWKTLLFWKHRFCQRDIIQIFLRSPLVIGFPRRGSQEFCLAFTLSYLLSWCRFPVSDVISPEIFPCDFQMAALPVRHFFRNHHYVHCRGDAIAEGRESWTGVILRG